MLLLAALASTALALDGNDQVQATLTTGEVIEGWYYDLRDTISPTPDAGEVILLSGDNKVFEVPVLLLEAVEVNGEPRTLAAFGFELDQIRATKDAWLLDAPPHPRPGVVIGLSMGWAGAGHAALGEWKTFAGYSVMEAILLGTAAYTVGRGSNLGVLLPIAGVDLLFRGYAASDAARISRRRRARHGLRPAPGMDRRQTEP